MKKYILYLFLILGVGFLFNSSVCAITISTTSGGTVINDEYIYNKFVAIGNDSKINKPFDINKYSYIACSYHNKPTNVSLRYIYCYAFKNDTVDNLYYDGQLLIGAGGTEFYYFQLNGYSGNLVNHNYLVSTNLKIYATGDYDTTNMSSNTYTNFKYINSNTDVTFSNNLNFNKYMQSLAFDENLFANNENFKKVCVDSDFSITKTPTDGVLSESDHDFIWFPYGISGIKQFNFSTEMSDGYYEFKDPYKNYYFSSYDDIDLIWNTEYVASNFESKGYTDKYKYYGYTAYLFLHWYNFNGDTAYNYFPIFVLENPTITHISSSGSEHGGGGTRLDGDEDIELTNEYCFYIKKEYEVNEVKLDEWGDYYTSVNTPNGIIEYNTSTNKDGADSDSFLSQPIKFISEMSGTIAFINGFIYNFYLSMPLVVRMFIITSLIIVLVMLIMKIGGYK